MDRVNGFAVHMLSRSRLNLLLRQPSVSPLPEEGTTQSHTISEGVGVQLTTPTLETPLAQSETPLMQLELEGSTGSIRTNVGVAGEEPTRVGVAGEEPAEVGVAGEEPVAGVGPAGATVLYGEESVSDEVRKSPGFKFLTREDLYKFAKVRCVIIVV